MKKRSVMMKPASSLCNMRCKYCFYADISEHRCDYSFGKMPVEKAKRVIDGAFSDMEAGDELTLAFKAASRALRDLIFIKNLLIIPTKPLRQKEFLFRMPFRQTARLLTSNGANFLRNIIFCLACRTTLSSMTTTALTQRALARQSVLCRRKSFLTGLGLSIIF